MIQGILHKAAPKQHLDIEGLDLFPCSVKSEQTFFLILLYFWGEIIFLFFCLLRVRAESANVVTKHNKIKSTCHSRPPYCAHNALLPPRIPCWVSSTAFCKMTPELIVLTEQRGEDTIMGEWKLRLISQHATQSQRPAHLSHFTS